MQIARFLETSREPILKAASDFARTIPSLRGLNERALRNHLPHVLEAISADLRTTQSRTESITKSHGEAPAASSRTSAQTHGLLRAQLGITIEQLVAEYRALRSSVLRLWGDAYPPGPGAIEDMTRFNEAIDQAIAESVEFYAEERERWRQIFLGIVGHDLRSPLNAIALTVELMAAGKTAPPAQTALLSRGVKRLTSLLDSLLEYSRASLGTGMVLRTAPLDLGTVCAEEMELLRAAFPDAEIDFSVSGSTAGEFDGSRVSEALTNLVSNAIKHGDSSDPTVVTVEGMNDTVRISVENTGDIASHEFEMLFEPLRQREAASAQAERSHLGLGLFIARQIARAHGGEIVGTCTNHRVRFTLELPKNR